MMVYLKHINLTHEVIGTPSLFSTFPSKSLPLKTEVVTQKKPGLLALSVLSSVLV